MKGEISGLQARVLLSNEADNVKIVKSYISMEGKGPSSVSYVKGGEATNISNTHLYTS